MGQPWVAEAVAEEDDGVCEGACSSARCRTGKRSSSKRAPEQPSLMSAGIWDSSMALHELRPKAS